MHGRKLGLVGLCGVAAAAGGGIWMIRAADRAPEPAQVVAAEVPAVEPAASEILVPVQRPRPSVEPPPAPVAEPEPVSAEPLDEAAAEEARRAEWERMRAEVMRRMDTDGDGEVSDEERDAARAQWEARGDGMRRLMMQRYDADGDGELSREERGVARDEARQVRQEIRDRIVPEYDLDGDGELNEAEREAARPAFEAEFDRLRVVAQVDRDGSRTIEPVELAEAIVGISDGDPNFDFNRDGATDYLDATYITEIAQSN